MIEIILLILIGLKLDIMNGLYLALIIIEIILWIFKILLKITKILMDSSDVI